MNGQKNTKIMFVTAICALAAIAAALLLYALGVDEEKQQLLREKYLEDLRVKSSCNFFKACIRNKKCTTFTCK